MKRILVTILLIIAVMAQLAFANSNTINEDVKNDVIKEIERIINEAYSKDNEIRNFKVDFLSDKVGSEKNDLDVNVSFEVKYKYKDPYEHPLIAGAYKRLGLDKNTKQEDIVKTILKKNKNITLDQALEIKRILMGQIREIKDSGNSFSEVFSDYKIIFDDTKKWEIKEILTEMENGEFVSYKDTLPRSYDEIFKAGYDTIIPTAQAQEPKSNGLYIRIKAFFNIIMRIFLGV